jgi:hypothetical protein
LLFRSGEKTIFGPKDGTAIKDIVDGTANTLLVVDADENQAVIWTKPQDLPVDDVNNLEELLFGTRKDGFGAVTADGAWRLIGPHFTEDILRALLTRNGEELFEWP